MKGVKENIDLRWDRPGNNSMFSRISNPAVFHGANRTYDPRFASVNHLDSHLALGVDLCELSVDIVTDKLGDFVQSKVGHESNGEFAYSEMQ